MQMQKAQSAIAAAERGAAHHSPVAPYALQCHCPQCEAEGYSYGGRYFKAPDVFDLSRLVQAEKDWAKRCHSDLEEWWPKSVLPFAMETHLQKGNLTTRGYTHYLWVLLFLLHSKQQQNRFLATL